MTLETKMEELINFTRLTRKKEAPDCPIAKKREKSLKKRKVRKIYLFSVLESTLNLNYFRLLIF